MSDRSTKAAQAKTTKAKTKAKTATRAKAKTPKAKTPTRAKAKTTKAKTSKSSPKAKAGLRLPWAEVVSRVIGQPAEAPSAPVQPAVQSAPALSSPAPAPAPQPAPPEAPTPPPTTIRFPSTPPRKKSSADEFAVDEWVSVTYCGEGVFVHGKAGIFAQGTTTRLRGRLATELASKPGFRVRRAA